MPSVTSLFALETYLAALLAYFYCFACDYSQVIPLVILRNTLSVIGRCVFHLDPDSLVALRAIKLTGFVPILNVELFPAMRAGSVKTHYAPTLSAQFLQSGKPYGKQITGVPQSRHGKTSIPDLSSSSASRFCNFSSWSMMLLRSVSHCLHLHFICFITAPQSLSL
jgi:hypothetical protein